MYVRLDIETVCPAEITTDDRVMSPPPPVAVTEHRIFAVPAAFRSSALAAVPPVALVSETIAAAVAVPLDAEPKAVFAKVNVATVEPPEVWITR